MDEFEPIAYSTHYGPADDEDDWETVYPGGFSEEQEPLKESVKPIQETDVDGYVDEWEQLMDVAEAVESGRLEGVASGNGVVAVVAAMLRNEQKYEYSFGFNKVKE